MNNKLREYFSGRRKRFKDGSYNLDLTYISDRIIAMGYPSTKLESLYRNSISDVSKMLTEKHGDHYLVINLCERDYCFTLFGNRVISSGFPDHHSPPLALMWSLYSIIDLWLALDSKNVVAIHCLAGKGRTGMAVCCTLLMQGFFNNLQTKSITEMVNASINFFHEKRGDGVENPDQIRFIYQFLQSMNTIGSDILLQSNHSIQPLVYLGSIIFYNFPIGENVVLSPRISVYLKNKSSWHIVFNSVWSKRGVGSVTSFRQAIVSVMDLTMCGDLLFVVYDDLTPLFHFSVSTILLPRGSPSNPSSIYLNHTCLSFESNCSVPFTASFAVQLLCFKPSLSVQKNCRDIVLAVSDNAVKEELLRRATTLIRYPSYRSSVTDNSPVSVVSHNGVDIDVPMLWKGAMEPRDDMHIGSTMSSRSTPSSPSNLSTNYDGDTSFRCAGSSRHLSVRLSSSLLPPPTNLITRRARSYSDDVIARIMALQRLSLAFGTQEIGEGSDISLRLPPAKERCKNTKNLTANEVEVLKREGRIVRIEAVVDDAISSISKDLSSEVVLQPTLRSRSDASSTRNDCIVLDNDLLADLCCDVLIGDSWKRRLIAVRTDGVRVMRRMDGTDVKRELRWNDIETVMMCKATGDTNHMTVIVSSKLKAVSPVYIQFDSFSDAQSFVITARELTHNISLPLETLPAGKTISHVEVIRWLLFLFCPQYLSNDVEIIQKCSGKDELLFDWMMNEFGLKPTILSEISNQKLNKEHRDVIVDGVMMSYESYLLPTKAKCTVPNSIYETVKQLHMAMSKVFFSRLVQIACISYPSPIPLLRAVVKTYNADWAGIFDKDPAAFMEALQQYVVLKRESYSFRSFHL